MIDAKGRCCGRKPVEYKGGSWRSPSQPQKFCTRCDKAYALTTNAPIENWAYFVTDGKHAKRARV